MNKASLNIIFFYTIGLLILAMGLTLNTKANLGVSPIISIPYCFSQIFHLNFGNATLVLYCIFVVIKILLHLLGGKRSSPQRKNNERFVLIMDLLQIPLSIVFTRFLNLFTEQQPYSGQIDKVFEEKIKAVIHPDDSELVKAFFSLDHIQQAAKNHSVAPSIIYRKHNGKNYIWIESTYYHIQGDKEHIIIGNSDVTVVMERDKKMRENLSSAPYAAPFPAFWPFWPH